ncbi:MAG: 23S rRNA pseudouridylate synthase B, partial [Ralstonia mannitolilytica]
MPADADAQPPRQEGSDGAESSAPRRKGLRRGLRNLVASRRQQQDSRPEGEGADAAAAPDADQSAQPRKSRAPRTRKPKEAPAEVAAAEGAAQPEPASAEGQDERRGPRG